MRDALTAGPQHAAKAVPPTVAHGPERHTTRSAALAPPKGPRGLQSANLSGRLGAYAQLSRSAVILPRAACDLAQMVEDGAGLRVRELQSR